MAQTATSVVVPTSVEVVWEGLAEFGEISRWGPGVDQSSMLSDLGSGVGACRRVQVGRNTLRETVTVWEPLQALGYRIEGLPPVVRTATNLWTLAVEGSGTRVTLTSEVQARGGALPSRIGARVLGRIGVRLVTGLAAHVTGTAPR